MHTESGVNRPLKTEQLEITKTWAESYNLSIYIYIYIFCRTYKQYTVKASMKTREHKSLKAKRKQIFDLTSQKNDEKAMQITNYVQHNSVCEISLKNAAQQVDNAGIYYLVYCIAVLHLAYFMYRSNNSLVNNCRLCCLRRNRS